MIGNEPLLRMLVKDDTQNVLVQLFRYTFVGGIAFLFDFATLFVLTHFAGIHYLISAGLGFTLGLTINYILSVKWVFSIRKLDSKVSEFGIFALIGLVGLAMNELFMWFFTERVGLFYLVSKIALTFFVFLWNFSARRLLLFQKRHAHE